MQFNIHGSYIQNIWCYMLISKKNNFIFVHIKKTAGTSITKSLSPYDDRSIYLKILNTRILTRIKYSRGMNPLPHHAPAYKIKEYIGSEEYEKYFSFAFVRNPFDWQISNYFFIKQSRLHPRYNEVKKLSFNEYLDWTLTNNRIYSQSEFISDKSDKTKIIVDYVGKLENIDEDFDHILKEINLDPQMNLKFTNKSKRNKNYKQYYDEYSIEFIKEHYKTDLDNFSYNF